MEEKPNEVEDTDEKVADDDDDNDVGSEDFSSEDYSEEDEEVELEGTGSRFEAPLTEQEVEELVGELLEVESKAAEAQEALEEESLQKIEQEVREELSENLQGDDLEKAVVAEMAAFSEEWEATLDDLETESADLLEQLDGAGIDLPSIYKWIESKAPNGCCTEAWKKRTHWVGNEAASDAVESIKDAEKHLQTLRPVRRKHGKTLEEGASGYLAKRMCANESGESMTEKPGMEWNSFNKLISDHPSKEDIGFGSKQWASVYFASTPQQAAALGLDFPGVDEVEEIDDIDDDLSYPFIADAIEHEKQLDPFSDKQKTNYKKVKEEDDLSYNQKLQLHLKRKRNRRSKQKVVGRALEAYSQENSSHAEGILSNKAGVICQDPEVTELDNSEPLLAQSIEPVCGSKWLCDDEISEHEAKRCRIGIVESDNEVQILNHDFIISGEANNVAGEEVPDQEHDDDFMKVDESSENMIEKFDCTACGKTTKEILEHPLLKVIVCGPCKGVMEAKLRDSLCSECYCGWCGSSNDLLRCKSCELLFCTSCIKRNVGVECLPEDATSYAWQCCSCNPDLLQHLTFELEKAVVSQDSSVSTSDSDSGTDDSDEEIVISTSLNKTGKKKIRRILEDTELGEETKRKIAMEKERQERLKSLKAQFSRIPMMNASCNGNLPEGASSEVLGDAASGFIVNVVREEGEDAVRIPPSISAKLKTHQVAGIRFMWENIIQSIRNVKSGDKGLGCILAHTMGLGKTFQVIAFLYTAMRSVDLGLKTALIVTPLNVLHNWRQEFKKWEPKEFKPLRVYMLEDKSREQQRAELLMKWRRKGGVFLIGYSSFRNLSLAKNAKDHQSAKEICYALQEGPDILVCDEAHIIKNIKAETTQAFKLVKCQRRIALTGSPLQNNLMEYYCMVDFVREGFLGSMHEFRNRFQNPIEFGQHANSTAEDVRIMNQRSHILYEQLKGFVQRMDMSVAQKDLPPKTVFVISVKPSSLQRKLYKRFLDVHGFTGQKGSCEGLRKKFFAAYQTLAQICNHPWVLQLMKDRGAKREDSPDESFSDENMDSNLGIGEKVKAKVDRGFLHEGWWTNILNQYNHQEIDYSGKMVLLLDILTKCTEIGDKALVFSQSIATLEIIESYLSKLPRPGKKGKHWKRGKDWYRIDGKTQGSERQRIADAFNNPQNRRVKCTLLSTRAGALGINLFAANRVIIVDGSWNPTNDLQAIYRAWRYGQKKPVYAYRLVAHGTLEEKVYKRQVKKEGLAARVVDRQQVLRSMSKEEISDLFNFGDEDLDMLSDMNVKNGDMIDTNNHRKVEDSLKFSSDCPRSCSSDRLMEKLLDQHRLRWIMNFFEHETLLQENEEEKLTKEEQDLAWEVFRRSMEWQEVPKPPVDIEWQEVHRRVPADLSTFEQKLSSLSTPSILQERSSTSNPLENISTRYSMQAQRCTNISHLYILKLQGTKMGCTTVCGGCGKDISWESLN